MLEHDWANGTVTRAPARGGYGGGRGYNGCGGYQTSGYQKQKIQQLEQEVWELRSQTSEQVPEHVNTQSGSGNTRSQVSKVTIQEGSIMGGQSDQSRQRQRPRGCF